MRRGFLLDKPREKRAAVSPPVANVQKLQHEQTASSSTALPDRTSEGQAPGAFIPIPTDMFRLPGPPAKLPPPEATKIFFYTLPDHTSPPHLITKTSFYEGMIDRLADLYPGFPQAFSTPSPSLHKIVPVEGTGLGMIATADIAPGETILRERPLMTFPMNLQCSSPEHAFDLFDSVVDTMHPDNKRAVYALQNSKGDAALTPVVGILNTNSFKCRAVPLLGAFNVQYGCLARDISRANHRPNACFVFEYASLTIVLRAIRHIQAGQEITLSYLGAALSYAERQARLTRYDFTCTCPACRLPPAMRRKSDLVRSVIVVHSQGSALAADDALLDKWLAQSSPQDIVSAFHADMLEILPRAGAYGLEWAKMLWEMMEAETYVFELWEPVLVRLVKGYAVLENEERVRHYATKAAGLRIAFSGSDGGWRAVAENPRMTDWWAKRGKSSLRAEAMG